MFCLRHPSSKNVVFGQPVELGVGRHSNVITDYAKKEQSTLEV